MENLKKTNIWVVGGAVVLCALVFWVAARGFSKQASFVEVKGLSERIVKADVAVWSINFEVKSNNVDALYADIDKNLSGIKSFLLEKGFDQSEINIAPVNIYQDTYRDALFRYNSTTQLSLYTNKVDLVKSASKDTLPLLKRGITMNQNYVEFKFSDINSIKPEMLKESVRNAKETASQIAKESGARLGKISRGNQGVFDITDKDPGSPEYKKVRLVSTLRFLLK